MSAPLSSPLPWRIDGQCIRDADGLVVVSAINPCGMAARLRIVEAVNERDRLRDIVLQMIPAVEESFAIAKHEAESIKVVCGLTNVDCSEVDAVLSQWEDLLREARAAIGEGGGHANAQA